MNVKPSITIIIPRDRQQREPLLARLEKDKAEHWEGTYNGSHAVFVRWYSTPGRDVALAAAKTFGKAAVIEIDGALLGSQINTAGGRPVPLGKVKKTSPDAAVVPFFRSGEQLYTFA